MRDLRDFFNPHLTATINGHEFTVQCPTAAEGLRLRMLMMHPDKANEVGEFEEINRIFRGRESNSKSKVLEEGKLPTGGLWDELWEKDVTFPEAMHLGITAITYFGLGEDFAVNYWESKGKGLTAPVQTKEPEPKKKASGKKKKTNS